MLLLIYYSLYAVMSWHEAELGDGAPEHTYSHTATMSTGVLLFVRNSFAYRYSMLLLTRKHSGFHGVML